MWQRRGEALKVIDVEIKGRLVQFGTNLIQNRGEPFQFLAQIVPAIGGILFGTAQIRLLPSDDRLTRRQHMQGVRRVPGKDWLPLRAPRELRCELPQARPAVLVW